MDHQPPRAAPLPYQTTKIGVLDKARCYEAVDVQHRGDASSLLSINRLCLLLNSAEQVRAIITSLDEKRRFNGARVVGLRNRFAAPSRTGYIDLKFYLEDEDSGHISTGRVLAANYENTVYWQTAPFVWELIRNHIAMELPGGQGDDANVVVSDNFLKEDSGSLTLVTGFASWQDAESYASARFRDKLLRIQPTASSVEDLKYSWLALGEDIAVIQANKMGFLSRNLTAQIAAMTLPMPDYLELENQWSLSKVPLSAETLFFETD